MYTSPTHQHAVAKGGPHGALDLLGDKLGDGQTVVLSDVVQQTQSVVLYERAGEDACERRGGNRAGGNRV